MEHDFDRMLDDILKQVDTLTKLYEENNKLLKIMIFKLANLEMSLHISEEDMQD